MLQNTLCAECGAAQSDALKLVIRFPHHGAWATRVMLRRVGDTGSRGALQEVELCELSRVDSKFRFRFSAKDARVVLSGSRIAGFFATAKRPALGAARWWLMVETALVLAQRQGSDWPRTKGASKSSSLAHIHALTTSPPPPFLLDTFLRTATSLSSDSRSKSACVLSSVFTA